jgi:hypothetical protein
VVTMATRTTRDATIGTVVIGSDVGAEQITPPLSPFLTQ